MEEFTTLSVALYRQGTIENAIWIRLYDLAKNIMNDVGDKPNYVGIIGGGFKSGNLRTIERFEKSFRQNSHQQDITALELYTLPPDFVQAAFDYHSYCVIKYKHGTTIVLFTCNMDIHESIDIDKIINQFQEVIQFEYGKVFEMMNTEVPAFYVSGINSIECYPSLRIIQEF